MASFEIALKPSVHKDLRRLPKEAIQRVMARIESLGDEPLPEGVVRLSGAARLHRIRVGNYRIIYEVDPEAKLVTVHYVRHRRDVYRAV